MQIIYRNRPGISIYIVKDACRDADRLKTRDLSVVKYTDHEKEFDLFILCDLVLLDRSISSGDSLTAIVVPTANGSSHGGHRSSEGFMSTASEADSEGVGGGTGWSGQRRRQESCDPPSPMRSRGSGGSDGYCSPFRRCFGDR